MNVVGSLLLGALAEASQRTDLVPPALRLSLGVGFLGGFTTYSTFNQDLLRMLREAQHGRAALYLCGTLLGGLAAGLLGAFAAARLAPPR